MHRRSNSTMTHETANEENNNAKRTKTDVSLGKNAVKSPDVQADATFALFAGTLPFEDNTLVTHYYNIFKECNKTIANRNNIIARFKSDADYFPKSTRTNFEIGCSHEVEENGGDALTTLRADTETAKQIYKETLKQLLLRKEDLEKLAAIKKKETTFVKAVTAFAKECILSEPRYSNTLLLADHSRGLLMYTIQENTSLLTHVVSSETGIAMTKNNFYKRHKAIFNDHLDLYVDNSMTEEAIDNIKPLEQKLKEMINHTFVLPWDVYNDAKAKKDQSLLKLSFVEMTIKEDTTTHVAMNLGNNDMTEEVILDLVRAEVKAALSKKDPKKVNFQSKEKQTTTAKNGARGAKAGAQTQTKTANKQRSDNNSRTRQSNGRANGRATGRATNSGRGAGRNDRATNSGRGAGRNDQADGSRNAARSGQRNGDRNSTNIRRTNSSGGRSIARNR
jgi:hypothetical protein